MTPRPWDTFGCLKSAHTFLTRGAYPAHTQSPFWSHQPHILGPRAQAHSAAPQQIEPASQRFRHAASQPASQQAGQQAIQPSSQEVHEISKEIHEVSKEIFEKSKEMLEINKKILELSKEIHVFALYLVQNISPQRFPKFKFCAAVELDLKNTQN